jgi:hypothetical protein
VRFYSLGDTRERSGATRAANIERSEDHPIESEGERRAFTTDGLLQVFDADETLKGEQGEYGPPDVHIAVEVQWERSLTVADLSFNLPDELVERIAERAAAMIAERQGTASEDGWLRGAEKIAAYIDCPESRVYALNSAKRLPVEKDGSALIARRSDLDAWVRNGGGKRP